MTDHDPTDLPRTPLSGDYGDGWVLHPSETIDGTPLHGCDWCGRWVVSLLDHDCPERDVEDDRRIDTVFDRPDPDDHDRGLIDRALPWD